MALRVGEMGKKRKTVEREREKERAAVPSVIHRYGDNT